MWLAIAAITMLFLAFTSALIVRQGLDELWQPIRMPRLLTANTIVLMLSSVLLELARRRRNPKPWLVATLSAGILFVAGQLTAWRQLADAGLLFSTSAHASFFYTLTAVHGLHLAGGLMALGWLTLFRGARARWLEPAALYWHFMGALWLYLMYVLFGIR
jgi:cytochrome c oxidase subunit 3